jgi:hypothetical protein
MTGKNEAATRTYRSTNHNFRIAASFLPTNRELFSWAMTDGIVSNGFGFFDVVIIRLRITL